MKLKRRNKANPDFSLAAMVDVILLLLIFFMVTSSAAKQSAIDVKLPNAEASASALKEISTVTITEDGKYFVNDKPITTENLENYLVNALKSEKEPAFTIRADENTRHKDVVFVMEIAEKHKFNLAIATTKK